MTVRVRAGVGGQMRVQPTRVESLEEGTTLADLLDLLRQQYGVDVDRPNVLVAVNGWRVGSTESQTWLLKDRDVVAVVDAMAGG